MRTATLFGLALAAAACQSRSAVKSTRPAESPDLSRLAARDSADSVLHTPRVVTGPAVIVFWVAAGDTLHPDDAAAAYAELTAATERIVPALAAYDIQLFPTNADTVYIELPNREWRPVLLTGLDYPFGYLLAEPGGVERILTGVYGEEELLEEIRSYFDLPEDTTSTPPRVTT